MKKNSMLFITCNDINSSDTGGKVASKRNLEYLKTKFNIIEYIIQKKNNIRSLFSIVEGYFPPIEHKDFLNIKNIIIEKNIIFIFFDGTYFGTILHKLKNKSDLNIITFFHNVEYDYFNIITNNVIKKVIYRNIIYKSEQQMMKESNITICLTSRDQKRIEKLYKKTTDYIIPITIEDKYVKVKQRKINEDDYCLIVSALHRDTLKSVIWYKNNIAPYIERKTKIVGKGFEQYKKNLENEKIEVVGSVNTLQDYYRNAACVVLPIIIGAGMKVKTAEALMYSKNIIGLEEAFVGYEFTKNNIVYKCKNDQEMIIAINKIDGKKKLVNTLARNEYINKYSIKSSDSLFNNIFKNIL